MNNVIFQNINKLYNAFSPLNSCDLFFTFEEFSLFKWHTSLQGIYVILSNNEIFCDIERSLQYRPTKNFEIFSIINNHKYSCILVIKDEKLFSIINVSYDLVNVVTKNKNIEFKSKNKFKEWIKTKWKELRYICYLKCN